MYLEKAIINVEYNVVIMTHTITYHAMGQLRTLDPDSQCAHERLEPTSRMNSLEK